MLTAYDFPTARILDEAGSRSCWSVTPWARNVLGYDNELPVTMEDMLHHLKAVARGARTRHGRRRHAVHAPIRRR